MADVPQSPPGSEVMGADELGPVDYVVVEFPGDRFDGAIAPQLDDLVDQGLIRLLDIRILKKAPDGTIETAELSDLEASEVGGLRRWASPHTTLLSGDDLASICATIEPGSSAGILVWESVWKAPFADAVRKAGGRLVAKGRIPATDLPSSPLDEDLPGRPDPRRLHR